MSYEKAIRAKHSFQTALKEFFRYASAMTNEEIELAMGRIADFLTTSNSDEERFHYQVKGQALKIYFDLRVASQKNHGILLRRRLRSEMREYFASLGVEEYQQQEQEHQKKFEAFRAKAADYEKKWGAWNDERKKFPLLKRLFNSKEMPEPPPYPSSEQVPELYPISRIYYMQQWENKGNMDEFLIARIANFTLFAIPEVPQETQQEAYDLTPEDVKLLSP